VSLQVLFLPEAALEAEEAIDWYEAQQPGLGLAFLAAMDRAVQLLARWPRSGSQVPGVDDELEVRRLRVPAFP
jgi:toxin ParE1/3/4